MSLYGSVYIKSLLLLECTFLKAIIAFIRFVIPVYNTGLGMAEVVKIDPIVVKQLPFGVKHHLPIKDITVTAVK